MILSKNEEDYYDVGRCSIRRRTTKRKGAGLMSAKERFLNQLLKRNGKERWVAAIMLVAPVDVLIFMGIDGAANPIRYAKEDNNWLNLSRSSKKAQ
jgi:hypothetical protein